VALQFRYLIQSLVSILCIPEEILERSFRNLNLKDPTKLYPGSCFKSLEFLFARYFMVKQDLVQDFFKILPRFFDQLKMEGFSTLFRILAEI
jgi:hypothetical protein